MQSGFQSAGNTIAEIANSQGADIHGQTLNDLQDHRQREQDGESLKAREPVQRIPEIGKKLEKGVRANSKDSSGRFGEHFHSEKHHAQGETFACRLSDRTDQIQKD